MKVKDILDEKGYDILYTEPENTVYECIAKMADHNIGALLVMKDSKLLGIISERDYRNKIILKGKASKETKVSEIMVDKVIAVKPTDNINLCMQLMTNKKIRHLPVLNDEKVVGVISIGDVVKAVIRSQKNEIDSLRDYIATGGGYMS
ncbi:CBS domain-containing protein [Rhodohalobacter sp. SW132]|uniref:CBS domain-containing protein n=1 Tax=Rhodohalobacter sp. SW132 TaxID=2293433 RepID=UPI000E24E12C|nr:CBS domain-containing protein [Rhodohalobacter sp. SW132]REL33256.1 CBS domain-containing protein [Rhodohalobacter sp. SW132]